MMIGNDDGLLDLHEHYDTKKTKRIIFYHENVNNQ